MYQYVKSKMQKSIMVCSHSFVFEKHTRVYVRACALVHTYTHAISVSLGGCTGLVVATGEGIKEGDSFFINFLV